MELTFNETVSVHGNAAVIGSAHLAAGSRLDVDRLDYRHGVSMGEVRRSLQTPGIYVWNVRFRQSSELLAAYVGEAGNVWDRLLDYRQDASQQNRVNAAVREIVSEHGSGSHAHTLRYELAVFSDPDGATVNGSPWNPASEADRLAVEGAILSALIRHVPTLNAAF